jgi:hypothetical protein
VGSACVSGYERLIDSEGIFTVSVSVGSLARAKVRLCVVALARLLFSGLGSYFGLVKPPGFDDLNRGLESPSLLLDN